MANQSGGTARSAQAGISPTPHHNTPHVGPTPDLVIYARKNAVQVLTPAGQHLFPAAARHPGSLWTLHPSLLRSPHHIKHPRPPTPLLRWRRLKAAFLLSICHMYTACSPPRRVRHGHLYHCQCRPRMVHCKTAISQCLPRPSSRLGTVLRVLCVLPCLQLWLKLIPRKLLLSHLHWRTCSRISSSHCSIGCHRSLQDSCLNSSSRSWLSSRTSSQIWTQDSSHRGSHASLRQ